MKRIEASMFYPLFFIFLALLVHDPILKTLDTITALLFFSADVIDYLTWKVWKK